eukprot:Gb_41503 [translate_table: standard]
MEVKSALTSLPTKRQNQNQNTYCNPTTHIIFSNSIAKRVLLPSLVGNTGSSVTICNPGVESQTECQIWRSNHTAEEHAPLLVSVCACCPFKARPWLISSAALIIEFHPCPKPAHYFDTIDPTHPFDMCALHIGNHIHSDSSTFRPGLEFDVLPHPSS